MEPLSINLLVTIAVLIFFLVQGLLRFNEIKNSNSYFLIDRNLGSSEYSYSFAAASTSLATVLYFFVTLGVQDGLYILWAPLTYAIGAVFFNKILLPKIDEIGFFSSTSDKIDFSSTLGRFIHYRYQSRIVKYSVLFVTFLGMISILLIELFIGVTIFSIYLKPEYVDYSLVVVAIIVFLYSTLGGFPAVIKTDNAQFKLIIVATLFLIISITVVAFSNQYEFSYSDFVTRPILVDNIFILPYPLLFNILIVNLLLIPSLLRTWQMNAASQNSTEVKKGIWIGVAFTTVLTTLFILIGIIFFKIAFPGTELSLNGLLSQLSVIDSYGINYIVFPLFFAACLSALLSTADSSILPITQTIYEDFFSFDNSEWKLHRVSFINLFILIFGLSLYFVVFRILEFDIISWLFTIFSFLIVASPIIVFSILSNLKFLQSYFGIISALIALWGGLAIAIYFSIIGQQNNMLWLIQLNTPLAALWGFIVMGISRITYFIFIKYGGNNERG